MQIKDRLFVLSIIIGVIITVVITLISEWLIRFDHSYHQNQYSRVVSNRLELVRSNLQRQLDDNMLVLEGLETLLSFDQAIDSQQFNKIAGQFLKQRSAIDQVQLSPNAVITHVYPTDINSAKLIGLNLLELDGQQDVIKKTIREGNITLAGPIKLVQGGTAFIARRPVYLFDGKRQRFWGFITLLIDENTLFHEAGLFDDFGNTEFLLQGVDATGAAGEVFLGDKSILSNQYLSKTIDVPGGNWLLAADIHHLPDSYQHPTFLLRVWGIIAAIVFGGLSSAFCILLSRLYKRATHDPLTQVYNRQHFQEQAEIEIAKAQRHNFSLAVLMIDLDHFKPINDTFGHQWGDKVLIETAELIGSALRKEDILARYGGEEFVALIPYSGYQRALSCAERIREALDRQVSIQNQTVNLSASIGIATLSKQINDYPLLVMKADEALYKAKDTGRNCVVCNEECACYLTSAAVEAH